MTTKVPCDRCGGTGLADLSPTYRDTLSALNGAWMSTQQIHAKIGRKAVARTTLCNRLTHLAKLGVLERRPSEKSYRELEWRRA